MDTLNVCLERIISVEGITVTLCELFWRLVYPSISASGVHLTSVLLARRCARGCLSPLDRPVQCSWAAS
jgi:hypothetical protein